MQPIDEPFCQSVQEKPEPKLSRILRLLSADMRIASIFMANRTCDEWLKHAYELTGAADMVSGWSQIAKEEEAVNDGP